MNLLSRSLALSAIVLLLTTHPLPAPIQEVPESPTPGGTAAPTATPREKPPSKPKPKPKSAAKESTATAGRQELPSTPKPAQRQRIVVRASEFLRPLNVALGGPPGAKYGTDVLLNGSWWYRPNAAEFDFSSNRDGQYQLKIEYAAGSRRPCKIIINGRVAVERAMNATTGCWEQNCQQLLNQGTVMLKEGKNTMRVERDSVFPHIRQFVFEPIE